MTDNFNSTYDELNAQVKALGDYVLQVDEQGQVVMTTLEDTDVGIFRMDISPIFHRLEYFEEWFVEMKEIFGK